MTDLDNPKPPTRATIKLLDASIAIFGEPPASRDAAFLARELVQCTLPHKNPGNVPVWVRRNGNVSLVIQPGYNSRADTYGYPYGTIPRLLLFWLTTEALRTSSPRLELGNSLNGFMAELGLNPATGGGKRGDAKRLREQMERLFRCRITFEMTECKDDRVRERRRDMLIAEDSEFWWSMKDPEQAALWGSWIELGHRFYEAITAAPVPVDMRALKALKRSPLALDLYSWLTYEAFRAHKSGKPRYETWGQLHTHLGGEYANLNDFRRKTKAALVKIRTVYPGLKLGKKQGGVEVLPDSYPALLPRQTTIDGTCNRQE